MLQSIKQLYTDSPFPVVVYDGALNAVWENDAANNASAAEQANLRGLRHTVQAERLLEDIAEHGIAHCRRTPALSEKGITFLRQGDYIVAFYEKEKTVKPGKAMFYNLGGVDSLNAAVRTDVSSIVLASTALERNFNSDDPEAERLFQKVRRDSYRMLRNVNNMTLLARYYDGELQADKKKANIGSLVRTLSAAAIEVCGKKVPVTVKGGENVKAAVDVSLFERALLNILLNAFSYTADGNAVEVSVGETANAVTVTVRDRGTGIHPDIFPDVQSPYFSAEPAGDSAERPGLGLGLTVANIFCTLHGGTLFIESEFGRGTAAVLSFAKTEGGEAEALETSLARYVTDRFSPIYVELCGLCEIPY